MPPFARITIDSYGAPFEAAMRGKEMAVMFKIVYSNLESLGGELLS